MRAPTAIGVLLERERERNRSRLGLSGLGQGVLGQAVRRVTIRSQFTPREYHYQPGAPPAPGEAPREGGFGDLILRLARPEVEVETPLGRTRVAPYGRPRTGRYFWPVALAGGAAALFAGGSVVYALVKLGAWLWRLFR